MKLYKFYENGAKQVFGTFAENKSQFFYSGFESAEEAKQTTIEAHVAYKIEKLKPNQQGIKPPISLIKTQVEMSLDGVWSEIE